MFLIEESVAWDMLMGASFRTLCKEGGADRGYREPSPNAGVDPDFDDARVGNGGRRFRCRLARGRQELPAEVPALFRVRSTREFRDRVARKSVALPESR